MKKHNLFYYIFHNIAFSVVLGVILVMITLGGVTMAIGYRQYSIQMTEEYSDIAFRIAHAAEKYIAPDYLDDYLEEYEKTGKQPIGYITSYSNIQNLCDEFGCEFIYVIIPDEDYRHITFVYNIVNKDSAFDAYPIGYYRETTNDEYAEKYREMVENNADELVVVRDHGYVETGNHITAMISLKSSSDKVKGILCVQRQMDALTNARHTYLMRVLLLTLILAVVSTAAFAFNLARGLILPLKRITAETERFARESHTAQTNLTKERRFKNEIGVLASSVEQMELNTVDYINNLTRMTAEQERIGTELEVAASIQRNMLNSVFPEREEFEIYAFMTPAKEVGGDFYDFFMIDDDHLGLVIADVSGKGIPAAMFMTVSKIVLADALMMLKSPKQTLEYSNDHIAKNNPLDMFVTVWMGSLELSTGILRAANAGHENPALYRNGNRFELVSDPHGFVLGSFENMKYKEYEIQLKDGDAIFVFTDGVNEATDRKNELFGTKRLLDALNQSPEKRPQELLENVKAEVDRFVGDAPQFDDLTMLSIKYHKKQ